MNILIRDLDQHSIDAVDFAKKRCNEKTAAKAVLRALARFQSQERQIIDLRRRNSEMNAKLRFYEHAFEQITRTTRKLEGNLQNDVVLYQSITGRVDIRAEELFKSITKPRRLG